ncbi:MAG: hypothetical protein ACI4TD_10010 [Phocaeicola sp.]
MLDIVLNITDLGCKDKIDVFFSFMTFFISILALVNTKCEYGRHVKRRKSDTLSKLSERYATDKNIESVVKELLACYDEMSGTYLKSRLNPEDNIYSRELFIRFFDELTYAEENDAIDMDNVCYNFGYYAVLANFMGSQFLSDYESGNWGRFRQFAKNLNELGGKKGYFHFKANGDNVVDELQIINGRQHS